MLSQIDDADLEAQDKENWTPFHHAIRLGKDHLFEILVTAYKGKRTNQNISALDLAALLGNKRAIQSIIAEVSIKYLKLHKLRFFICLCLNGSRELLDYVFDEKLIDPAALIDKTSGRNILHIAVSTDVDITYLLNKEGVKDLLNKGDRSQRTPLHIAAKYSTPEICEVLVNFNASVEQKDSQRNGNTPIHYASSSNNNTLKILLDHIPDDFPLGNSKTRIQKTTPLHISTKSNCMDNLKLILEKLGNNLDPNFLDSYKVRKYSSFFYYFKILN